MSLGDDLIDPMPIQVDDLHIIFSSFLPQAVGELEDDDDVIIIITQVAFRRPIPN